MDRNEVLQKVRAFTLKELLKNPDYALKDNEPLFSSGLIDSFSLMDLSLFVEGNFGVRIEDTELNAETFDTLEQLATLIQSRQ